MIKIDKEFVRDVLNFVKMMDAITDFEGNELYIHRGLRIALETGEYTGQEKEDK